MSSLRKRKWYKKDGTISVSWELSYQLDGKQVKKVFKKKPSMQEMLDITKVNIKNPKLKDFIKEYIETHLTLNCKGSTLETYWSYYNVNLPPLYHFKIKNIKMTDIERFIISMKVNKSPKTINNILVFIKGMFNYAIKLKLITESPARYIKPVPRTKKRVKVFSEDQLNLFKQLISNEELWVNVFFSILIWTGMRISECIALEWDDIDFENKIINVNKQYYRYRLTSTKNYEIRDIEIPDMLVDLLIEYYKYATNRLLFSLNDGNYISVNNVRERYFNKFIRQIEKELNCSMRGITPHCLRHTHASTLLSNGIPIKYVSKRLGHKSQKTTLNIYDHVLKCDIEKALVLLNRLGTSQSKMQSKVS